MGKTDSYRIVQTSDTSVKLSWGKLPGANMYEIWYRRADVSGDRYVKARKTGAASFVVKGLKTGASYVHVIGTSKISSAANTAAGTVTLKWKYVSMAKGYVVYRSTSRNGKYVKLGTSKKPVFEDKKAVKGKTYYYKVITYTVSKGGVASKSAYSNIAAVKSVK